MINLLIVDADQSFLTHGKELFSGEYNVLTAVSGEESLSVCGECVPDLMIVSSNLSDMRAPDLHDILQKKHEKSIPILYLHDAISDTAFVVHKPVSDSDLRYLVQSMVHPADFGHIDRIDELTGVLCHTAAAARLADLCSTQQGILMVMDIDRMKLVNEMYGHKMGDILLKGFAEILRGSTREDDVIGRMDGDEFILFSHEKEPHTVSLITERLNRELLARAKLYMGSDMDIPIGVSIGAVLVPDYGTDFAQLYHLADKALYTVKEEGRHGFYIHGSGDTDMADKFSAAAATLRSLDCTFEERSQPGRALWVGKEAFTQIYRFFLRYISSYSGIGHKLLFTLTPKDSEKFGIATDMFGDMLARVLRKSDMMVRLRQDQYFLLIPNIKPGDFETLVGRLMTAWSREEYAGVLEISYEAAMIATAGPGTGNRRQGDKK